MAKTQFEKESMLGSTDDIIRKARQAVREAVLDHKRAGNPIVGMEDGKIVTVRAEEIDIMDEE